MHIKETRMENSIRVFVGEYGGLIGLMNMCQEEEEVRRFLHILFRLRDRNLVAAATDKTDVQMAWDVREDRVYSAGT